MLFLLLLLPIVLPEKCHLLQAVATTGRLQQAQKGTQLSCEDDLPNLS